jgi:centromere/kinetochore protein ZW10
VITTLDSLGLLKNKIDHFHQQIDRLLIVPRLETQEGRIPSVITEGNTLKISGQDNDLRAARLFSDLQVIIEFLDSHLPTTVMTSLSRILVPNLTSRLISTRLSSSVPPSLDDLPAFEELLEETKRFEESLHKTDWMRERELSDWVERAPKVWLAKRREWSLDTTRTILTRGIVDVETVERSETETIQAKNGQEVMVVGVAEVSGADDWNAAWNDEGEGGTATDEQPQLNIEPAKPAQPAQTIQPAGFIVDDDDDGADGWGLDEDLGLDDNDEPTKEPEPVLTSKLEEAIPEYSAPQDLNDEEIDWGAWGDGMEDEGDEETPLTPASNTPKHARKSSVSGAAPPPSNQTDGKNTTTKDVTLTETYTITSTPRMLLGLISSLLAEANQLQTNPQYMSSPIAPAAGGIRSIPTLILSVFRALAPLYYAIDLKSNMYLYNDCIFLSSNLPEEVNEKDASQIMVFAKRQYSREMEAQRTIFCDYLDRAQGFTSCTEPLQRQECDHAINATTQHLRSLHAAWQGVLSKSALYQSVGSLLNTVVTKFVNDIEDLSDISEPESVALAKYCADIADLEEELFPGRSPGAMPVTPIYCAGWMKFRYLEQILGSSMKEIMMLIHEGCLREFEKEEVVELVKALFADSEMRHNCIEDIRRVEGMH